jgi:hypothetical protein
MRRCRTISFDPQSGDTVRQCRGTGGYSLLVEDSDLRVTVTVLSPDRRRYPLNYTRVVTPAMTTLGDRAEWRVERQGRRRAPVALIVPVVAYEELDFPHRVRSYLAVAKLRGDTICVTETVPSSTEAAEVARHVADSSAARECLRSFPPQ